MMIVAMIMVTGCEDKYPVMYDTSNVIVGLNKTALSVKEQGPAGTFNVYLGALPGTTATDVTLAVSVEGFSKPAIEGTDYTISSKNVSVGVGEAVVTITPIDNAIFEGDKKFKLTITGNSQNYVLTPQNSITVTLVDDEHPLKNWIGTYTVAAASYGVPGAWDEEWTVTTAPVAGDVTKLSLTGISGPGSGPVIAKLDKTAMTIEIAPGQALGAAYGAGNGPVGLYWATDEILALAGAELTAAMIADAATHKLTGTIQNDGTILIDRVAPILTDYVYSWDVFNTTWTKN